MTVARTVSLWDPGEFIASIHILGIAHPPGSPMFMILGKTWEYLFFFVPHIALRINLLSVFCSVASCLILFEIALLFAEKINLRESLKNPCALLAGLLLAFSDTFWFNGVEAEVYAFSMMNMLLSLLTLFNWANKDKRPHSHLLLLFVYLSFAGIGVHMYSMLLFPFLYFFAGLLTKKVHPGRWLFAAMAVLFAGFSLCFLNPDLAESTVFLVSVGIVLSTLGTFALIKKEVTDIPFWSLGLLLCSVVSMTKPFIIAVILLWFLLCFSSLILNRRHFFNWIFLLMSCLLTALLMKYIPLHQQFGFSSGQLGTTLCVLLALITVLFIWLPIGGGLPEKSRQFGFLQLMVLMVILGYSSHVYLPIRAIQNPVINENNPATWHRVQGFIERKQYGSENMLVRMFNRRGNWESQFGYGHHMGFFRHHSEQYFSHELFGTTPNKMGFRGMYVHTLIAFLLLTAVLLVFFENIRRNPRWMGILLLLYFVTSVGLILYMNFADGNRIDVSQIKYWKQSAKKIHADLKKSKPDLPPLPDANVVNRIEKMLGKNPAKRNEILQSKGGIQYSNWKKIRGIAKKMNIRFQEIPSPVRKEVRDRHYFFTPAFVLFTLMLALAFFITLDKWMSKYPGQQNWIQRTGIFVSLTLWLLPFLSHYNTHTRAGNYIASDFAYNLLQSCPPNAILFTNGDNDTFPLWYLQQVEKIRLDVSVINFSLANTDWYPIQFIQHEPRVRLPTLEKGGSFLPSKYIRFKHRQIIPLPGDTSITIKLGGKGVSRYIRGQDRVVIEAALYNYPQRPICFTLSTPGGATLGLSDHFQNVGLVNVVSPSPGINLLKLEDNLFNVYRFRNEFSEYADPASKWLLNNYRRVIQTGKRKRLQRTQEMIKDVKREREILNKYQELEQKFIPQGGS